jgi:hypothetical protein
MNVLKEFYVITLAKALKNMILANLCIKLKDLNPKKYLDPNQTLKLFSVL